MFYVKSRGVQHCNTLRFVMPNGRHILLRSDDEHVINEWIHLINYASAFRTAGVKICSDNGKLYTRERSESTCDVDGKHGRF
jgi:hypothetical protein